METAQTGSHSSQTQEGDGRQDSQVVGMCSISTYVYTYYLMSMKNKIFFCLTLIYVCIQEV